MTIRAKQRHRCVCHKCAARDLNPVPWIKSPVHSRTCSRRENQARGLSVSCPALPGRGLTTACATRGLVVRVRTERMAGIEPAYSGWKPDA
jgi:hypothetical protein